MAEKKLFGFLFFIYAISIFNLTSAQSLKVSKDNHFLVYEDGTPFFILVIQPGNYFIVLIGMKLTNTCLIGQKKVLPLYRL